jgi:hypothetical protein
VGPSRVFAVTDSRVFVNRGASFQPAEFRFRLAVRAIDATPDALVILGRPSGPVYFGAPKSLWRSTDLGKTWQLSLGGAAVDALAATDASLLAMTEAGLQSSPRGGKLWRAWDTMAGGEQGAPAEGFAMRAGHAYRLQNSTVSTRDREHHLWRAVVEGLDGAKPRFLAATPKALFAATAERVYKLDASERWWRAMDPTPRGISRLLASGSLVCAATLTAPGDEQAALHCFRGGGDRQGWRLRSAGLFGEVHDLWIDPDTLLWQLPRTPRIFVVGTDRGLFWSVDGGASFDRAGDGTPGMGATVSEVASISRFPAGFMVAVSRITLNSPPAIS